MCLLLILSELKNFRLVVTWMFLRTRSELNHLSMRWEVLAWLAGLFR